jgi:hypothetical protein
MRDVIAGLLILLPAAIGSAADIVWHVEAITFALEKYDALRNLSQHLVLNQALRPGETGWVEMNIDLPNSWVVSNLSMRDGRIDFTADGSRFRVGPENLGKLVFAILDGAPRRRPDEELARLWRAYALHER